VILKSRGVVREGKAVKVGFIQSPEEGERRKPRAEHIPISSTCKVLEMTGPDYHAGKGRREPHRVREDASLIEAVKEIRHEHKDPPGIARIVVELAERGRFHPAPAGPARGAGLATYAPARTRRRRCRTRQTTPLVDLVERSSRPINPTDCDSPISRIFERARVNH
jgi:hypothetical protein